MNGLDKLKLAKEAFKKNVGQHVDERTLGVIMYELETVISVAKYYDYENTVKEARQVIINSISSPRFINFLDGKEDNL